jgi:hypothetical protein
MLNVALIVGQLLHSFWSTSDTYPSIPAMDNLAVVDSGNSGAPPAAANNKDVKIVIKKLGFNPKVAFPQILVDELPNMKVKKIFISTGFLKIMHPVLITVFMRPYGQRLDDVQLSANEIVFRSIQSEIDNIIKHYRFTTAITPQTQCLNTTYLNEIQLTTWEDTTNRNTEGKVQGGEENLVYMAKQVVWCTYYDIT